MQYFGTCFGPFGQNCEKSNSWSNSIIARFVLAETRGEVYVLQRGRGQNIREFCGGHMCKVPMTMLLALVDVPPASPPPTPLPRLPLFRICSNSA